MIPCNHLQRHSRQYVEMLNESAVIICWVFIGHQCQLFSSYSLTLIFFALNSFSLTIISIALGFDCQSYCFVAPLECHTFIFFLDILICLVWTESNLKQFLVDN